MANTRTITIQGEEFTVTQPYEAGHTVTEMEAKALNQVRAENIRNNLATKVKKAQAGETTMEEVHSFAATYDAEYQFTAASAGSGTRALDPVEREARKIARAAISKQLTDAGRKIKDIDKEKLEAAIEQVAATDDVLKMAKKRVAEQQKATEAALQSLGDLNLAA